MAPAPPGGGGELLRAAGGNGVAMRVELVVERRGRRRRQLGDRLLVERREQTRVQRRGSRSARRAPSSPPRLEGDVADELDRPARSPPPRAAHRARRTPARRRRAGLRTRTRSARALAPRPQNPRRRARTEPPSSAHGRAPAADSRTKPTIAVRVDRAPAPASVGLVERAPSRSPSRACASVCSLARAGHTTGAPIASSNSSHEQPQPAPLAAHRRSVGPHTRTRAHLAER